MKSTEVHPIGWTEEDAKLVAEYVAEVKKDEAKRKKTEWRKEKEIEAGQLIQKNYYKGLNSPRDVPEIRAQAGWLKEQNQTEKPFGYYEQKQRKENKLIFIVAVIAAVLFFTFVIYPNIR